VTPVFRPLFFLAAFGGLGLIGGSVLRSRAGGVEEEPLASPVDQVPLEAGMAIGPPLGTPVLRVFGDYECPACRALERAAGDTLRALARRGRIRFVYHHAPLRAHLRGPRAAVAAYCALDAGVVWSAHAALYASAPEWGMGPAGEERLLEALAPVVEDTATLHACITGDAAGRRVTADRSAADALRIREVPTVFFGDRRLRVGSWPGLIRYVTAKVRSP
jgi:protein-disulfide isomerase